MEGRSAAPAFSRFLSFFLPNHGIHDRLHGRLLCYGGWLLAVLDLLANVAIVHDWVQVSRAQAAAIVERDALRAELAVRQVPRPPVVAVPAPPPAEPVRARTRPRPKSVPDMPPPVPESEKWWNQ